jgi:enoyl-CoA hydratase/carnithine racemase
MELAREIAGRSPNAVRAAKQLWNQAVQGTVEEGLALEERLQRTLMGKPNQLEAVQAGMQKREPSFSDPE